MVTADAVVIDPMEMVLTITELIKQLPGTEIGKLQFIVGKQPENFAPGLAAVLRAISDLKDIVGVAS